MTPAEHLSPNEVFDGAERSPGDVQRAMTRRAGALGMPAALEWLDLYSRSVGYLADWMIDANERHTCLDPDSGIPFRLQINRTRARYNPASIPQVGPDGRALPPLHCPLCRENVGRPGKEKLRIHEFELGARRRPFFIQLTPFPLCRRHFILIHREPIPMRMDRDLIEDLLDFLALAPDYTVCSNSDVEWAGASILTHLHYQVFDRWRLPIMDARPIGELTSVHDGVEIALLDYPCPVLRLSGADRDRLARLADLAIREWRDRHPGQGTFNVVAWNEQTTIRLCLIYRHPDYRTPPDLVAIKSEGVGVIEMAGEGIYPEPRGEQSAAILRRLREDGLPVILGIIRANAPLRRAEYARQFARVLRAMVTCS